MGSLALAQQMTTARRAFTAADYERAEKFMAYNTTPLVFRNGVRPNWLAGDRFWYHVTTREGGEFIMVDPAKGTRAPAFDHVKLAAALSTAAGSKYDAAHLPFTEIDPSADGSSVAFNLSGRRYSCDVAGAKCEAEGAAEAGSGRGGRGGGRGGRGGRGGGGRAESLSPDGKKAVFIREDNLWVRELATGKQTQLTKDGLKDFGYSTDNAGWSSSDRPIVAWSPDSRRVATFQQDQRGVGEMYLVNTQVGHPTLRAWKYPLPGDPVVTTIQRVIVDVDDPHVVRFDMPPDQHRSTLCDDIACRGGWDDVQWDAGGTQVAFVSTSRDHKQETLRIADAVTGKVRDVFEEKVDTFFESGNGRVNWFFMPATKEVIWFSERENWGQLYLYDVSTGKLKNHITSGDGNVTQLLHVDEKNRVAFFLGVGKEKGRDPYFFHLYRVNLDGTGQKLLTPEDANHDITLSPDGAYFVDSYSKPDTPPVAVVRDAEGSQRAPTLETADISKLLATGWKPPQPIVMKARDGVTDIYGLMFKPSNLDPATQVPHRQPHLSRPADRQRGQPQLLGRPRRLPGAGRAGLHRGRDRRHGHALALQEIPRSLLRQHGRQHPARPGGRHEASWPRSIPGST